MSASVANGGNLGLGASTKVTRCIRHVRRVLRAVGKQLLRMPLAGVLRTGMALTAASARWVL